MTMITPSYLGETIEYSSLHACRSTLEDPTDDTIGEYLTARGIEPYRISDGPSSNGKMTLMIVRVGPNATWSEKTQTWSCPVPYLLYVSEAEVVAGKPFVHCVK